MFKKNIHNFLNRSLFLDMWLLDYELKIFFHNFVLQNKLNPNMCKSQKSVPYSLSQSSFYLLLLLPHLRLRERDNKNDKSFYTKRKRLSNYLSFPLGIIIRGSKIDLTCWDGWQTADKYK